MAQYLSKQSQYKIKKILTRREKRSRYFHGFGLKRMPTKSWTPLLNACNPRTKSILYFFIILHGLKYYVNMTYLESFPAMTVILNSFRV